MKVQPRSKRSRVSSFALASAVLLTVGAWLPVMAQTPEETKLRELTDSFLNAYQTKDLAALVLLWSSQSPYVADDQKKLGSTFAENKQVSVEHLSIAAVNVSGPKALIRITAPDSDTFNRILHLVKERETWKIWRYVTAEEDLANRLGEVASPEDRAKLLGSEGPFSPSLLAAALLEEGWRYYGKGESGRALALFQVATELGNYPRDKQTKALAWSRIGAVRLLTREFQLAVEAFKKSSTLAEEIGDRSAMVGGMSSQSSALIGLRKLDEAEEVSRRSLSIAEELGDKSTIAAVLVSRGELTLHRLGDLELAKSLF